MRLQKRHIKWLHPFVYSAFFSLVLASFCYGMTPQELDGKIKAAAKLTTLPTTDIWKELPAFLNQRSVTTHLRAAFSKETRDKLFVEDVGVSTIVGALTGLVNWGIIFASDKEFRSLPGAFMFPFIFTSIGALDGFAAGFAQGLVRRFLLFPNSPWVQTALEPTAGLLTSMGLTGTFSCCVSVPNQKLLGLTRGLYLGFINSAVGMVSNGVAHAPDYSLLTEAEREDLLKYYLYYQKTDKKTDLFEALQKMEAKKVIPRGNYSIPQAIRIRSTKPTAVEISQGTNKNVIVTSAFNGTELSRDLELDPQHMNNTALLLTRMNAGLGGTLWTGATCFEFVAGNYGRYLGGEEPGFLPSCKWKKIPAVMAWGRPGGHPGLILVAFCGTKLQSLTEWVSNIKGLTNKFGPGHIHAGFCDMADSCASAISKHLTTAYNALGGDRNPGIQVLFTGHSRGAAVALVAALKEVLGEQTRRGQHYKNELNTTVVINFAQPRVSEEYCAEAFEKLIKKDNVVRFVTRDKVSKRSDPIAGYQNDKNDAFGFYHIGTRDFLDSSKRVWIPLLQAIGLHDLDVYRESWQARMKNK